MSWTGVGVDLHNIATVAACALGVAACGNILSDEDRRRLLDIASTLADRQQRPIPREVFEPMIDDVLAILKAVTERLERLEGMS